MWLHSEQDHHIAAGLIWRPPYIDLIARPPDSAQGSVDGLDHRTFDSEVIERVTVDLADGQAAIRFKQSFDGGSGCASHVKPPFEADYQHWLSERAERLGVEAQHLVDCRHV
jgi:hypothetical protein